MMKLAVAVSLLFGGVALADDAKPAGGRHKPPQEALDACAKAAANDACAFTHDSKEVKGSCLTRKHGPGLVCRKPHAPPPAKKA